MIKWIFTGICMIFFVLLMTNKKMEMRTIFNDYQYSKGYWNKAIHIERGKEIMRPRLIPYMLEIYASGHDIEFAEAMIDSCQEQKATDLLWEIALNEETKPLVRTICLAHLLNRDELRAWTEITDEDIEVISASMPAHVVHWKHLLVKYVGVTHAYLNKDTFPERHKFKATFRRCIEMYKVKEADRKKIQTKYLSEEEFPEELPK
ncbi:hypothetical protein EGM51_17295 [Verrucomicrobia bacterium S94]|nr:hypothetical protein EGM51_17295 [Verrucomicrobia bacterium S94]